MKWDYERFEKQLEYAPKLALDELRRHYCHARHIADDSVNDLLYLIAKAHYFLGDYKTAELISESVLIKPFKDMFTETKWINLIASALNVQGHFVEAHNYYQMAVYRARLLNDPLLMFKMYGNLGYISNDLNAFKQAKEYFEQALVIGKENSFVDGSIKSNFSYTLSKLGEHQRSIHMIDEVLLNIEETTGIRWLGFALENKGRILREMGQYIEALKFYRLAQEKFNLMGNPKDIAVIHNRIAEIYLKLKMPRHAIEYFELSISELVHLNLIRLIGKSYFELAQLYDDMKNNEKSVDAYRKSFEHNLLITNERKRQQIERLNARVDHYRLKSEEVIQTRQSMLLEDLNSTLSNQTIALNSATNKLDQIEVFSLALTKAKTKKDIYLLCSEYLPNMIGYFDFMIGFLNPDETYLNFEYIETGGLIERNVSYDITKPSYAYYAIKNKKTIRIGSDELDKLYLGKKLNDSKTSESLMFVPMITSGIIVGVVSVQHHHINYYNEYDEALFSIFASIVAGSINILNKTLEIEQQQQLNHQVLIKLKRKNMELKLQSSIDSLTGLYNRNGLSRGISQWMLSTPLPCEMVVSVMDLDHFKRFNDTHGHVKGDQLLKAFGKLIKDEFARDDYLITRFGGEEFLLISSITHFSQVIESCNKLLEEVPNLVKTIDVVDTLTISIGIHTGILHTESDLYNLIELADQQLYKAKTQGRNRIVTA
jgi:diguanylate cyclase (GGDEF)-like protein